MQNADASSPNPSVASSNYSPSIPISIYREVTAELQTVQSQLQTLQTQNQQLTQQNQQLRQELENVVQSAIGLHQAINKAQSISQGKKSQFSSPGASSFTLEIPSHLGATPTNSPVLEITPQTIPEARGNQPSFPFPQPPQQPLNTEVAERLFTEPTEARLRPMSKSQRSELSGFWLIVSIVLIVVVAFGAGYWIVRPLLNQQR
ncbi:MAG: hypothetical protein AUK43_06085 [Oscillatoriales cyanobacterium CG2_30_40_61]|nr:MAG: hypothetical protein AUK43_06085 [Oscillatoriales cyanobacterium CG2_30_40_61]